MSGKRRASPATSLPTRRCTRLYAKDGWDFAAVDFGDEGTWNGPVFMLRPVLADA
jgi:hypothetical protein